jgi:hypothetical protein
MASLGWFEEFSDDAGESSSSITTASADSSKPAAAEEIPFESDVESSIFRRGVHAEGCGSCGGLCLMSYVCCGFGCGSGYSCSSQLPEIALLLIKVLDTRHQRTTKLPNKHPTVLYSTVTVRMLATVRIATND